MANRNYVSKTIEISVDRYNQLVACEATLSNIKKIIIGGKYDISDGDIVASAKYILQDQEANE